MFITQFSTPAYPNIHQTLRLNIWSWMFVRCWKKENRYIELIFEQRKKIYILASNFECKFQAEERDCYEID